MGSSWAEAWGLFFYCEGGLKAGEGEKQGTGSIRGEILKAFSAQVA